MGIASTTMMSTLNLHPWLWHIFNHEKRLLILSTLWCNWKWRNTQVIANTSWSVTYVSQLVRRQKLECHLYCSKTPQEQDGYWAPPGQGDVKLNVDGSCSNQKSMGGGGVLRGGRGDWQFGFSTCYGQGSPFLAEILAIRDGLMHAWRLGYRNIT
uniref:RNase H type-1 domain-containing protein n=1 Tax=Cajanus cajan TaxID=3821 RepID=A0A151T0A5_CAJCA|nr:hypothetical protein KK1_022889 [Cajanus cajan]